ncbi:MAG: hypothetical protein QM589_01130 [Thermomicrobiales bacterium]
MRPRLGFVVGVCLLAVLAIAGGPSVMAASATPDASPDVPPPFDLSGLAGLQTVLMRAYAADTSALLATPASAEATPDYSSFGVVSLSAIVFQFDSETDAAAGFEGVMTQVMSPGNTGGIDLKEVDAAVAGLGANTKAYVAAIDQGAGLSLNQAVLVTQDGAFIYETIVISLTSVDDAQATAVAVAQAMIAAPLGEGDGTLVKDGTSSGGVWEKFPKAGDPMLHGMTPEMDDQIDPAA